MPDFTYESLATDGSTRTGVLSAADPGAVVRMLQSRGEVATAVAPIDAGRTTAPRSATPALLRGRGRPTLRRAELANLIRELATAIEAGLPLMAAMRTVRRQASGRGQPAILDHLIERVERGDPLYAAAKEYGPPFDEMTIGMLRAADASGNMSVIMHQLADLLDRSVELRRDVLGATLYPMIVALLLLGSVILLVTVLIPKLIGPLSQQPGFTLPTPTAILLAAAEFIQSYWIACLVVITGAVLAWRLWSSVPANKTRVHRALLRIPVLGQLLRDVAVARFTRTFGTLTGAGLPILDALRITRNTLGNRALMQAIEQLEDQVTAGKSIADPLERTGLFPPLLVQVVNLGERSGRLDQMLLHAAGAFDRRVTTSIKLFSKALPPVLLIVMAGLGGFVLAAILLPLLELQNLVGQ